MSALRVAYYRLKRLDLCMLGICMKLASSRLYLNFRKSVGARKSLGQKTNYFFMIEQRVMFKYSIFDGSGSQRQ